MIFQSWRDGHALGSDVNQLYSVLDIKLEFSKI